MHVLELHDDSVYNEHIVQIFFLPDLIQYFLPICPLGHYAVAHSSSFWSNITSLMANSNLFTARIMADVAKMQQSSKEACSALVQGIIPTAQNIFNTKQ